MREAAAMPKKAAASDYKPIVRNRKFAVDVLDPKDDRRDNIRVTIFGDQDGQVAHHHLRAYEVSRLVEALEQAIAFGPKIPTR